MPVNIDSSAIKLAEEHLANPSNDMYRLQQQQVRFFNSSYENLASSKKKKISKCLAIKTSTFMQKKKEWRKKK